MSDIIDINVAQTVEEVTINVTEEVIQVNINQVNGGGGIESIEAGDNISVDNTDPDNPIVSATGLVPYVGATSDVNLGEFGMLTGNLEFDNTPTNIPTAAGGAYWNDSDGTLDLILKGGNVKLQVGQESVIRVVNKTATNINLLESNYQAVRVTGAQGQRLKVDLAQATTDILSAETIGLVTETINNNQEGFITTSGLVRNINTTGSLQGETWADGDIVYLSPTVAGRITKVKPSAPNHLVIIGYVVSAHATQGSIFVKVDNGYELDELHNVKIDTPLNNQGLVYNSTLQVWENKKIDLESVTTSGKTTTKGVTLLVPTSGDSLDSSLIVKLNSGGYTNGLIAGHRQSSGDRTGFISLMNVENFEQTTLDYEKLNFLSDTKDIKFLLDKTKANGNYTIATTSDIPSPITIDATPTDGSSNAVSSNGVFDALATKVSKSDYTPAHSILVQQSGTGTPTALSVGNNTLVGRLSGGGSDINDLSVSDVRTLLSIDTDLALKQDKVTGVSDTEIGYLDGVTSAIQTQLNSKANSNDVEALLYSDVGALGSHTGNTANTIVFTLTLPANTFITKDFFKKFFLFSKTGADGCTARLYLGTAGTTSDTLVATALSGSTQGWLISRERSHFNGSDLIRVSSTANLQNDLVATNNASSSFTLTADLKLSVAFQLTNSADEASLIAYKVLRTRKI
jgi:hypothetical protein